MKRLLVLWTCVLWSLAAIDISAAENIDVLKAIPDNAMGLAVVNRFAATAGKLEKLGLRVHAPVPALLPLLKTVSGITAGLDESGTIAVAMVPGGAAGKPPVPIVLIPVSDYDGFLSVLSPVEGDAGISKVKVAGKPSLAAHKGNFALLARPEDEDALKAALQSLAGVDKMTEPLWDWLLSSDAAVLALPKGVALVSDAMQAGFAQGRNGIRAAPGQTPEQLELALGMFDMMQQFISNAKDGVSLAGASASIDESGAVSLTTRMAFVPESTLVASLAKTDWPKQRAFAALPAAPFSFAIGMAIPQSWIKPMLDLQIEMYKKGAVPGAKLTDEQAEKLADTYRSMMGLFRGLDSGMISVLGQQEQPATLFSNMGGAFAVDDAANYLAEMQKSAHAFNEAFKDANNPLLPTYELKPVEVAGMHGFEAAMDVTKLLEQQAGQPGAQPLQAMFGDGKLKFCVVAINDHMIGMSYGNKPLLEKIKHTVNHPETGLVHESTIASTAALLPDAPQLVSYISPSGLVSLANMAMEAAHVDFTAPPFVETPPLGMALKIAPGGLDARFVVPAPVIDALGDYIIKIQQMRQQ